MKPYEVAQQGIARTFQNIALFEGMTVLDNVMTGRLNQMTSGLLAQAIWRGKAESEEVRTARRRRRSSIFLKFSTSAKTPVARLPYGLKKARRAGARAGAEPSILLLDEPMAG